MGVIEVSIIYGFLVCLFKSNLSIAVAAILFAIVCLGGLFSSSIGLNSGIQMAVVGWFCFNLSLFGWMFGPSLFKSKVAR